MSDIANHHSRVYLIESSELLEENIASFTTSQMRGWKPRTYARPWYPASGRQKTWGSNTQGLTAEPVALCGFVWWDLTSGLDEIWLPGSPCFIYYPVDFSFSTTAANRVNWICFSWTSVHSFPFGCFIIIFFIQIFISDGWCSFLN